MTRCFRLSCVAFFLFLGLMPTSPGHAASVLDDFSTNAPAATPPATNSPPPPSAEEAPSPPVVPDPATEAFLDAKKLAAEGHPDDALQKITTVIQTNPQMKDAWILRGNIYVEQKKWDLAEKDYQSALQIDANDFTVRFNLAEIQFRQKNYDAARPGFVALESDPDYGDLAAFKVFLCDLFGGHDDAAQKEFAAFNAAGSNPSYYFGNVAWAVVHKNNEEARSWLNSAIHIYAPKKVLLYGASLENLGYLPLPKPAAP
jgi:Tfp pilus assembly protein PilF